LSYTEYFSTLLCPFHNSKRLEYISSCYRSAFSRSTLWATLWVFSAALTANTYTSVFILTFQYLLKQLLYEGKLSQSERKNDRNQGRQQNYQYTILFYHHVIILYCEIQKKLLGNKPDFVNSIMLEQTMLP